MTTANYRNLKLVPLPRPRGMPSNDPQAMLQVTDRLMIPQICPHCCCPVRLENNKLIYGSSHGDWPWVYACSNKTCGAYVEVHARTDLPRGTLATSVIRAARKRARGQFDSLWQGGQLTRTEAYTQLAQRLAIPLNECHFSWFDVALCQRAETTATALQRQLRG